MDLICIHCERRTELFPCSHCGESPTLRNRYALEDLLGEGASGKIYRARDRELKRDVAVKELAVHGLESFKAHELFEREANILCRLEHPGIPSFYDRFSWGKGKALRFYLVMEFIDGGPLADELEQRQYTESEVVDIVEELARIAAYLHEPSPPVIHRDIKPTNVIRRPDDSLALVDFGSVRAALEPEEGGSTVAGTIGYMAPEQLRGVASPASDVYGIGALALHLLSRTPPVELLDTENHLQWNKVDVSDELAELFHSMLRPNPANRLSDAEALADRVSTSLGEASTGEDEGRRAEGAGDAPDSAAAAGSASTAGDERPRAVATRQDASANVWEIEVEPSGGPGNLANTVDGGGETSVSAQWRERLTVPQPEYVDTSADGEALTIRYRWFGVSWVRKLKHLGFLAFSAIWNVSVCFVWALVWSTDAPGIVPVIVLAHTAAGIGAAYYGFAGLFNVTSVHVDRDEVRVDHGPFPWIGHRRISTAGLEQLYCLKEERGWSSSPRFEVHALQSKNRETRLLAGVERRQTVQFIEDATESYLGIGDRPVGGELES
ncbi:MAG: serine/threonine protein kinase [Bradymonadaceae bacterium]